MGGSMLAKARKELASEHYDWLIVGTSHLCDKVQDKHTRIKA